MILRLLQRLAVLLASLLVSSAIVFAFMAVLPGDPARVALGVNASEEAVADLRRQFGLDRPLLAQYFGWLGGMTRFDLGQSYISRAEIAPQIADRLQVTLWLVATAMVLALVVAVPLGTVMAVRHREPTGFVLSSLSQVGVAVPAFLAGILLITLFAVTLRWLPANGWTPPSQDPVMFAKQLVLPALSLGLVQAAVLTRYVRSAVLDVLREDYLRTAQAKGLTSGRILFKHTLRAALTPIATVAGLDLGGLLGGAIITEQVFNYDGLGRTAVMAATTYDLPVTVGIVLVVATFVITANIVVDVLYAVIDPRVKYS